MNGEYDKIVYIRNNVEVKDVPSIGALPGGEFEKLYPFILPMVDCLGREEMQKLVDKERFEVAYLGTLRGRSFTNSIVICSEAQNLSVEHVKLIVGRIGRNSTLIFDGDLQQLDKRIFEEKNGLRALSESLKDNHLFGAVQMNKTERDVVAELASLIEDIK